jgi:hypothetical protein
MEFWHSFRESNQLSGADVSEVKRIEEHNQVLSGIVREGDLFKLFILGGVDINEVWSSASWERESRA